MLYDPKPSHGSGYLLWRISNLWQRKINDLLSQHDITHVQYLLLATISWMDSQNHKINQESLAQQSQSHKMMTSKVIRHLEKMGYVERYKDPLDTRSRLIKLTPSGIDKHNQVKELFRVEDAQFFGRIENNRFSMNRLLTDMIQEYQPQVS